MREIDELFFEPARRWPGRTALDAGERSRTYAALAGEVTALSASLSRSGGPVAVLTASPSLAIPALLACLDAGLTYAPLDPGWPAARLAAVGERMRPRVVLRDPGIAAEDPRVQALGATRVWALGEPPPTLDGPRAEPDEASTLFFTSGSTGEPKGIVGRRGGIGHYIRWERGLLGEPEGLRVSALAPCSFDASLRDAALPLSLGGSVCVPPDRGLLVDGARLAAWLAEARVEVLHTVPSVFRGLAAAIGPGALPALRAVLLAGEALRPSDAARFFEVFGGRVRLINLYGPTETTMTKLSYEVTPEDARAASIPLGRPMDGAEVFVVDSTGRPRPPERLGEIVLRTPFAAHGYLGQPEATARAFVVDLLGDGSPVPTYRTGDLGVLRADGLIEFRGRRDQQVKLRGVRVELEEVEGALAQVSGVAEAVAGLRDGADGEPRLCAWLVAAPGADPRALPDEARRHLASLLPSAALPSHILVKASLPRLFNGKVDRGALRGSEAALRGAGVAPEGPVERRVVEILAEATGVDIGATDDFFDRGGDSAQALRALWRLNEAFGVELPIDAIYRARTARALAALVQGPAAERAVLVPVELSGPGERPVFWLPPVFGLTHIYRPLVDALGHPAVALDLRAPHPDGTIEATAALAARLIRQRQPAGPYALAGWSFGGLLAFEVARQLEGDGARVDRLVMIDSAAPGEDFDFTAADPETAALAARRLGHMLGLPLSLDPSALRGLTGGEMVDRVLDLAASHGAPVSAELRRRALAVMEVRRSSMEAFRRYAPAPWSGGAWVLRAEGAKRDWTARWSLFLRGPIERRLLPGGHVTMMEPPHAGALVDALRDALYGAERPISSASTE